MKRILIAGYYGFGNAGDELILRSLLIGLKQNDSSCETVVLSNRSRITRFQHGTKAANRWNPWSVLCQVFRCDTLIFGGGGLLQDSTGSLGLWYYLFILWIAGLLKKKIIAACVGVGPIRPEFNTRLAASALGWVGQITVRDDESLSILKELGIKKEILVCPDPVLALPIAPAPARTRGPSEPIHVAVIPRNLIGSGLSKNGERQFIEYLSEALSRFAEKYPAKILILPFHPGFDEPAVSDLKNSLKAASEVLLWESLEELMGRLSGMDFVVSMRYHALVLAALMNIPMAGIAVDPKISHFLNEISLPSRIVNPRQSDPQMLYKNLRHSWENREQGLGDFTRKIAEMKSRAIGIFRDNVLA